MTTNLVLVAKNVMGMIKGAKQWQNTESLRKKKLEKLKDKPNKKRKAVKNEW